MNKKYWFCKYCGYFEEIGRRADVIVGLCPKCYHYMACEEWSDEDLKKVEKARAARVLHRGKK